MKSVIQIDPKTNELIREFESIKQASQELQISKDGISRVCSKRSGTCGGFKWIYSKDKDLPIPEIKPSTRLKPVIQLTLMGEFIREFSSQKEAGELLNLDKSHIGKVCRGQLKTCGGFKWKFK